MGINNFQKYIKNTYSHACRDKWLENYDNMYIDLNHILHRVCYYSNDAKDMLERTMKYMIGIIIHNAPKKRLILVADGPAPLAKLLLQKERRLHAAKSDKCLSLNLTPGTKFMFNLEKALQGFVRYVEKKYMIEVITLITDQNEGEIKIKYQLQKIHNKCPNDTHVVYSGDSDMILILFTCDDLSKIYQILSKKCILSYGTMYDIHIEKFQNTKSTKYDFVFINLLMGNDYLPKVSYIKLENVWDVYKKIARYKNNGLVSYSDSEIKIDPIFFHDLLFLASSKISNHFMKMFKISQLRWKLYYDYVQGLYWCFGMYVSGNCSNYKYVYDHFNRPHITGVMLTVMANTTFKASIEPPIDIELYGILLIPEKTKHLLSREQNLIIDRLIEKFPIIYEMERCNECEQLYRTNCELRDKHQDMDNVKKDILINSKKLHIHRKLHRKLTSDIIDKISEYFIECRRQVQDSVHTASDPHKLTNLHKLNTGDEIKTYNPYIHKVNTFPTKKLF